MDLTSNELHTVLDIVYDINNCTDITTMRKVFLESVKKLIKYDFGIFDLCKTKDNQFICFIDPIVISKYSKDFEDEFVNGYDEVYFSKSYSRWIHYKDEPIVYRETDFITDQMREKSDYYNFYLKPMSLIYSCGCELISDKKNLGVVTLYREETSGDYSDKELYILKLLLPHLICMVSKSLTDNEYIIQDIEKFKTKGLTSREMQILKLICKGYDNISISEKLFISINTVKKHIYNIFSKLEVSTRMQLMSKYNVIHNND